MEHFIPVWNLEEHGAFCSSVDFGSTVRVSTIIIINNYYMSLKLLS